MPPLLAVRRSMLLLLLLIAAVTGEPRQCCYSDACNDKTICSALGSQLVDSCKRRYIVSARCVLRRPRCCYRDDCAQGDKQICAKDGETLADSCGDFYRISLTPSGACRRILLRKCCFQDDCSEKQTCALSSYSFIDSCGAAFKVLDDTCARDRVTEDLGNNPYRNITVPQSTPSSTPCCYHDACDKSSVICAERGGGILKDSCGSFFRVGDKCKLTRIPAQCCYTDACDKSQTICAARAGGQLTDSCVRSYHVAIDCGLTLIKCCYIDACDGSNICASRTGDRGDLKLTDSCKNTYLVADNCSLSLVTAGKEDNECCYSDACDQSLICAPRGGILPDSCGRAYVVSKSSCKLAALQCCEDDPCPSPESHDANYSKTCVSFSFKVSRDELQLSRKDLFCTGFRAIVGQCGPRDDWTVVAAGLREVLIDEFGDAVDDVRTEVVLVDDQGYGHDVGNTARMLNASLLRRGTRLELDDSYNSPHARVSVTRVRSTASLTEITTTRQSGSQCFAKRCALRTVIVSKTKMRENVVRDVFRRLRQRPVFQDAIEDEQPTFIERHHPNGYVYKVLLKFDELDNEVREF